MKRSFNEAAHKLGDVAPPGASAHAEGSEATRKRFEALADPNRDVVAPGGTAIVALGALGVVYGDLGTSPLYTDQAIFTSYKATAHITAATVFGTGPLNESSSHIVAALVDERRSRRWEIVAAFVIAD